METKRFELEIEIKNYLNKLQLNGNLTQSDGMEIESHIKDGVDSLANIGLSEEEAFLLTLKRIGNADVISEEYNKVNPFFVSNKIRSYSIISLGLILSIGTIFLLVYDLLSMFRSVYLTQSTASTIAKVSLYLALCISILIVLKWGNSFTMLLQKNVERKPFLTAAILFLLPLISFGLQSVIIRYIDRSATQEVFNMNLFNIDDVQYVNFSFYLLVIAALSVILIWFEYDANKKKPSRHKSVVNTHILFLIFFSIVICLSAAATRYLHQITSGFQSSIFFAVIYTIGSFSIALYNNDKLWAKLLIFSMFSLFLGNLLVL